MCIRDRIEYKYILISNWYETANEKKDLYLLMVYGNLSRDTRLAFQFAPLTHGIGNFCSSLLPSLDLTFFPFLIQYSSLYFFVLKKFQNVTTMACMSTHPVLGNLTYYKNTNKVIEFGLKSILRITIFCLVLFEIRYLRNVIDHGLRLMLKIIFTREVTTWQRARTIINNYYAASQKKSCSAKRASEVW